jgi:chemotaxis protein CheX
MKAEYINPFITGITATFETMADCPLTRGVPHLKASAESLHDVSGVIGMSGNAVGTVVLSLSANVALKAASAMLMTEMTEVNADVIDAVGELTNMVAGSAKAKLEELHLSISLPTVITGDGHIVRFPSDVTPICIPFESQWGSVKLEVCLAPVAVPVEV